ncbi:hypothetical protein ACFL3G_07605 [Planctomycetota bacterium]
MTLISEGIEKVTVFELPNGIWSDGRTAASPRSALVKWRSSLNDKFYQVYVNGEYGGVTNEVEQREMVVAVASSLESAVRIEVFAVEAEYADSDLSSELDTSVGESGRVRLSFLRSQELPAGSTIEIYSDNGTGQIDYDNRVNDLPICVWPVWQDKAGFGMSWFGVSDFGYDSAGAVGFGKGSFGDGEFGIDADTIEWVSEQMTAGVYKFGVKVVDGFGNQSSVSETGEIVVVPGAKPAEDVSVLTFDKQANELVLSVD